MPFNWFSFGQQAQDAMGPLNHANDMAHDHQNDLEDVVLSRAIGYEHGTSQPYTTDRRRVMRILTRKGQILDGNPHRPPQVPDGTQQSMPRAKSDFEVVYHSDALQPIREEVAGDLGLQNAPYLDNAALARLEPGDLFKPGKEEWEQIPVSRFSPYESESPAKKTSLFRSLSKKVNETLFGKPAPRRPEISAPLQDVRYGPKMGADPARAMKYAVPILTPAAELANRAGTPQEAIEMRRLHADGTSATQAKATQPKHQVAVVPKSGDAKGRKVRIVGSPDRMTELGDFINLSDSDSEDYVYVGGEPASGDETQEQVEDEDDLYDQERRILQARRLQSFRLSRDSWMPSVFPEQETAASPGQVHGLGISMDHYDFIPEHGDPDTKQQDEERDSLHIEPLHPLRRPSKKVDTSRYSWKPPTPSPKAATKGLGDITDDHPTMEQLFVEIDSHMAEMDITDHSVSFASYDEPQTHRLSRPSSLEMLGLGGEDEERALAINTYIQGEQVVWQAGERIGAQATEPISNSFPQPRTDAAGPDDDEFAAELRRKLEALKK